MYWSIVRQSIIVALIAIAVVGPRAATAQQSPQPTIGITVTGHGQASAPAETATIQFLVGMENFGPPQAPDPNATPGASERERIAPVISSLVDAGIPEEAIETIVGPYISESVAYGGPAIALIRVDLDDPASERITGVVDAATVGAAQERLIVSSVHVSYGIADCATLEREAREAAIADAREQADVQAELLDVTLGELSGAADVSYGAESLVGLYGQAPPSSGCAPFETPDTAFLAYGPPSFDPTEEPSVTVYAQVELTFNMSISGSATPAP